MAITGTFFDKYAAEIIEYDSDGSSFIVGTDTIQSVSASVVFGSISVSNARFSGTTVYFTVSGGTPGEMARVAVKATLTSGQLREAICYIQVKPE